MPSSTMGSYTSWAKNQNGINAVQLYSAENQKGANAMDFVQR